MKDRLVIKIGSSSVIKNNEVDYEKLTCLANIIKKVIERYDILIVSSGAVAIGKSKLKIKPKNIREKQACAAIGQSCLIKEYEEIFKKYKLNTAQILLSNTDFNDRRRRINLENTISKLFEYNVIPIVNENDVLAVDEIKVGDNDTLAALTATSIEAKALIILSDVDGLYDKNPAEFKDAKLISIVENVFNLSVDFNGRSSSSVGTGGMKTKIKAAKICNSLNCDMIIINSNSINQIEKALNMEFGTYFKSVRRLNKFQDWLMYHSKPLGRIYVDEGAKNAVLLRKSLLPKGIISVEGSFLSESVVEMVYNESSFAKGIVNYCSSDIRRAIGLSLSQCNNLLGGKKVIIHANRIVLLEGYNEYKG